MRRRPVSDEEQRRSRLTEPLLGDFADDVASNPPEAKLHDRKPSSPGERKAWHGMFSNLIAQWTVWIGHLLSETSFTVFSLGGSVAAIVLSRIKGFVPGLDPSLLGASPPPFELAPDQAAALASLQQRLKVPYDGGLPEHQESLRALWQASFPSRPLHRDQQLVGEHWKEMGWQGSDPGTDFRGGGFIALENLLYFAHNYPRAFVRLLNKEEGRRSEWEYPFAVAGINITFMLIQMLDLRGEAGIPASTAGRRFVHLLTEDLSSFDDLFCVAFVMLDDVWLEINASYMEFNVVLQATRLKIEQFLCRETTRRVSDFPDFNRLHQ